VNLPGNGRTIKIAVYSALATSIISLLVSAFPQIVQSMARPDPFTGSEGRALQTEIDDLKRRVADLEKG
jgi:hypothetical protein